MKKKTICPKLTGEYSVGSRVFTITDGSRTETVGPYAGKEKRKLTYRIFYPVNSSDTAGLAGAEIISQAVAKGMKKCFHINIDYGRICRNGENTAEYFNDAPYITGKRFPLVLFSHGYMSYKEGNSFLCAEIASHGYVVVSVGHTYESMAETHTDGSQSFFDTSLNRIVMPSLSCYIEMIKITKSKGTPEENYEKFRTLQDRYFRPMITRQEEWISDSMFVYEHCRNAHSDIIDSECGAAASGHSFGGCAAYHLCLDHPEFVCGLNIDGALYGDFSDRVMNKPFFQICSEANYSAESKPILNKTAPAYYAVFKKIKHIAFSDIKFRISSAAVTGKIPADVAHERLCRIHIDFLDRYLKHQDRDIFLPDDEYTSFEIH